jgi:hypothetical protein
MHGALHTGDPGEHRLKQLPLQVQWPEETNSGRARRRLLLTECDRLLTKIEEHNLARGGDVPVPTVLLAWFRRLGGHCTKVRVRGDVLIEAVFALQESAVRQPLLPEEPTYSRRRRTLLR